jgi:energy-coupling factor transporter ATP-binding protein EcfA2
MTDITLTPSQTAAFNEIVTLLKTHNAVLLQGSAGTGKTTLTKYITEHLYDFGTYSICAIAPTHKARRVINNVLNSADTIIPITTFTIASALSKIREHSYVGTKLYGQSNVKKLSSYNLFIVDEVSMISDPDMRTLLNYVAAANKHALLIGDSNQIPCPNAGFYHPPGETFIQKCDSYVFSDPAIHKVVLTDIVRQAEGSPIIQLATFIRTHINEDIPMETVATAAEGNALIPLTAIHDRYCEMWAEAPRAPPRVIAYTNAAVRTHNLEIRTRLHPDAEAPYIVGDIIMGYNSAGICDVIENGQDYTVVRVTPTAGYKVGEYVGLCGWMLDILPCDAEEGAVPIRGVFCINIYKAANKAYLNELIRRAQRVNDVGSHKTAWRAYDELKKPVIFIDDVYKYGGRIFTDTTLRETHPLLFTNVGELVRIGEGAGGAAAPVPEKIQSTLSTSIEKAYPGLIDERIEDLVGKRLSDSEQLADRYKAIDRDIFYGYAITAHKSQGSTYRGVIVDEPDFQKLVNKWNYRHGCLESRIREKNQLRYVAYTRARDSLVIAMGD